MSRLRRGGRCIGADERYARGGVHLNTIACIAVERLLARNIEPPVFRSLNLDDRESWNEPLLERFKNRIRGL